MGAEQTGRYSTTMGISIPVRRGRRPDWFLLARHFILVHADYAIRMY
jgi:hypothetical protein